MGTSGTQAFSLGRAAVMPLELAPLARKTLADAIVVFSDGTTYDYTLNGNQAVRAAPREAVQFNALARWAASQPLILRAEQAWLGRVHIGRKANACGMRAGCSIPVTPGS